MSEIAAAKFSRNAGHDARQVTVRRDEVTAINRSGRGAYAQLAAGEARGLSLTEMAAEKFDRDTYN